MPLVFTRGSWANPSGLPRAELQRVAYLLREGKLVRQHLPVLDGATATLPVERVLLEDVQSFGLRYMDAGLTWQERWPTPLMQNSPPAERRRARPVAIEVTIKLKDYGTLVRIIEVPG
jgi:general secretion pathway protein J